MNKPCSFLSGKTFQLRYKLAKALIPKLNSDWLTDMIETRPMTNFAKNYFKGSSELVGIEIGVAEARNALSILKTLPMKTLYLIDPYNGLDIKGADTNYEKNIAFMAKERLSTFSEPTFIKALSEDAALEKSNVPHMGEDQSSKLKRAL